MLISRIASRWLVTAAALGVLAVSLGVFGAFRADKAEAAGFVLPSMGIGCQQVSPGNSNLILRLQARSYFTTITRVTLDVQGGGLEFDTFPISTTNFGPITVNMPVTPGTYSVVMTVSSTGNPDVTRTATATITTNRCSIRS